MDNLRYTIYADAARYCKKLTLMSAARAYFVRAGFRYMLWMRLAAYFSSKPAVFKPLAFVCRMMRRRYMFKYGIIIPYETQIGPGFYIAQFGAIVINQNAVIGEDCHISPGVTIGAKDRGKYKGVPVIGDRVYIGPGSKIIGSVNVGNDVLIGANCVVASDVPDGAVIAGVPGRVISMQGSAGYIKNIGYNHRERKSAGINQFVTVNN